MISPNRDFESRECAAAIDGSKQTMKTNQNWAPRAIRNKLSPPLSQTEW